VPDYKNKPEPACYLAKKLFPFTLKICHTIVTNPYFMKTQAMNVYTALIVDDEKDICYLLNIILKQKNIQSSLAGSLAEAEKISKTSHPAFVFLDNHLPDGLGLDYIQTLKKAIPDTRVIMITAHDNPSDKEKAFREGADFFISKPFTKEIIYKTLEQLKGMGVE
jgi:two-component system, OmpR family, response regulator